jgi:predicted phage terminase large subunit-like protein
MFRRHWFEERMVDSPLPDYCRRVRFWDLAATEPHPQNPDPDFTAGCLLAVNPDSGRWRIEHMVRGQLSPANVTNLLRATAVSDGRSVPVYIEQEGGSAGKNLVAGYKADLFGPMGIVCHGIRPTGSKLLRAQPVADAAQQRRVEVVRGPWVPAMFDELTGFPEWPHDDQVDALAGAFQVLADDGRPKLAPAVSGAKLLDRGPVVTA